MLYHTAFKHFVTGVTMLVVFRVILKIIFVDASTGFYSDPQWMGQLFTLLLALSAMALAFAVWRTNDSGMLALRGNRWLEGASIICGVAMIVVSLFGLIRSLRLDPSELIINALPRWMLLLEHALGMMAGTAMLAQSVVLLSGARHADAQGALALLPAIWQPFYLIQRFLFFRQVNTVSDQLLETLFLVCASFFWLHHARCIAGQNTNRKATLFFGLATSLLGLTLLFGQLAARAVLGSEVSGPDTMSLLLIGSVSLYAIAVSLGVAYSPQCDRPAPTQEIE